MELALLCDTHDAQAALAFGLVNRVVSREQLPQATAELARRLAPGPTGAVGETRRLLRDASSRDLPAQLDAEAQAFARCAATVDFREEVAAFFERRPARFAGGR